MPTTDLQMNSAGTLAQIPHPESKSHFEASSWGFFPDATEQYFGPDGGIYGSIADTVAGRLVDRDYHFDKLAVQCNKVPSARLVIRVYRSDDYGASWNEVAVVKILNGDRQTLDAVSVDLPNLSLHACGVTSEGGDYTGPVSWLLY